MNLINYLNNLNEKTIQNNKEIRKLQRVIYLYKNNIPVYLGPNNGYYYYSYKSGIKIYI